MSLKLWTGAIAGAALACAGPAAAATKGIGEYYNQKYESYGSSERMRSTDGRVAVIEESIETINCSGCDTVWYGPGVLLHLQNVGDRPVCAQLDFTRADEDDYSIDEFGSGSVHYIKPGKTAAQVRSMLPKAHFAAVYAKPKGRPQVDTFITEVSQDTWIYFPWDMGFTYQEPIAKGTRG